MEQDKSVVLLTRPLFAGLLLDDLLGLLLLGLEERADPFEDIRAHDQRGGDDGLAAGHVALAATLLVFVIVGAEGPVLGGVGRLQGPVDIAHECALDVLGLRLDNGHLLVELGEELVTELVGLGHVGLRVRGRRLEVGEGGLDEFRVARVGQLDRLDAVGVLLDGLDRVGDDRIGGEVLEERSGQSGCQRATRARL